MTSNQRGVTVAQATKLILNLKNVVEGRSCGLPSFLLNGRWGSPTKRRQKVQAFLQ